MESEKLRNSLLAAVSHDLRTPLTSLVGMTDTLARQQTAAGRCAGHHPRDARPGQRMHALVANWTWPGCKAATRRCGWNGSR